MWAVTVTASLPAPASRFMRLPSRVRPVTQTTSSPSPVSTRKAPPVTTTSGPAVPSRSSIPGLPTTVAGRPSQRGGAGSGAAWAGSIGASASVPASSANETLVFMTASMPRRACWFASARDRSSLPSPDSTSGVRARGTGAVRGSRTCLGRSSPRPSAPWWWPPALRSCRPLLPRRPGRWPPPPPVPTAPLPSPGGGARTATSGSRRPSAATSSSRSTTPTRPVRASSSPSPGSCTPRAPTAVRRSPTRAAPAAARCSTHSWEARSRTASAGPTTGTAWTRAGSVHRSRR